MLSRRGIFGRFAGAAAVASGRLPLVGEVPSSAMDDVVLRAPDGKPLARMIDGDLVFLVNVKVAGELQPAALRISAQIGRLLKDLKSRGQI